MAPPREADPFVDSAEAFVRKDLAPSSRVARRWRLLQSLRDVAHEGDEDVLEVGCGAGFTARYLEGRYGSFTGIDRSAPLIRRARQLHGREGVEFVCADVADYRPRQAFDMIILIGVLHHLADPHRALLRMVGMLRPGGVVVANEPQSSNPLVRAARRVRRVVDRRYAEDQVQYRPDELASLFTGVGLQGVELSPQGLVSTPFAEVVVRPQWMAAPAARIACCLDGLLERGLGQSLLGLTWNVVVRGWRPRGA